MKKKLLIVENSDSFITLNNVSAKLSGQHDIVKSQSGKDAMEILRNEHIDVVILDLILQDMDGLDLLKMIRMEISKTLPVLIENDHGNLTHVIESLRYGAYDIVRQDISFEYLDAIISKAIDCRDLQIKMQKFQSPGATIHDDLGNAQGKKFEFMLDGESSEGSLESFLDGDIFIDYKNADRKFKKRYFGHLLKLMNGNISKAAGKAGITRQGLHKILNGLKKEDHS